MSLPAATSRRPQLEALEDRTLPDANAFVTGLYQVILQRNGSSQEIAFWVNQLNQGAGKNQVTAQFLFGQEHITLVINHDYTTFLGRSPDPGGFGFWFNQLINGFPEEEMVANMVGSQEFVNLHQDGSQAAWLNDAYLTLLGRNVDGGGQNFWGTLLANGASLQQVASGILHSVESETSFVDATYQNFLNRAADSDGQQFWVNGLQQGATRYQVEIGFCASQEFENVHWRPQKAVGADPAAGDVRYELACAYALASAARGDKPSAAGRGPRADAYAARRPY